MTSTTNKQPRPCPTREQLSAASAVLNDWKLHYFQLLYFNGLTSPGANVKPFEVKLSFGYSPHLHVHCAANDSYTFSLPWCNAEDQAAADADVLRKCRIIQTAISAGKTKVNRLACCPLALPGHCVCDFKSDCPVHGTQCNGSHD